MPETLGEGTRQGQVSAELHPQRRAQARMQLPVVGRYQRAPALVPQLCVAGGSGLWFCTVSGSPGTAAFLQPVHLCAGVGLLGSCRTEHGPLEPRLASL